MAHKMTDKPAKFRSESINKCTKKMCDQFGIKANGSTPTKKFDNIRESIDTRISSFAQDMAKSWYEIGAKRGAAKMLECLMLHGIIPDDINHLKKRLEDTILFGDSLSWRTTLRHKNHPHNNTQTKIPVHPEISYSEIIEKLERSIYKKPVVPQAVRRMPQAVRRMPQAVLKKPS